ncbi:MAG: hypothetical protein INH34_20295 [Phycisphaerales bacterium]|jgi:hypothetical protein|nr:hypothetical protein [Phycisphaerales bacterium]
MHPIARALLPLSLAVPVVAQDATPREYRLATGQSFQGKALTLAEGTVHMKANILGSETDLHRKVADFAPSSQIAIESAFVGAKDFAGHMRLARRAAELDELELAGVHARFAAQAVKGAPDEAERMLELKQWAVATLTQRFEQELAAGHVHGARHYLDLLSGRLHDCVDAAALQAMDEKLAAAAASQRAKPAATSTPLTDAERKLVQTKVDAADKQFRLGLAAASKTVEACRHYDAALASYRAAWKEIEALLKKHGGDAAAHAELHDLGAHVMDGGKRAALQAATALAMQSNYKGAMARVNEVLAYAPGDQEALAMQRTIVEAEAAASGDWRWGWRTAGSQRPAQGKPAKKQ